ncbi:hypothetical protein PV377_03205 [Streptomyces ipomoeae]|uniref:hypothetical protein n=1 Tax=Streptomyces ipomoeae TaxID=103232 RepID=UPI0029B091DD|nr:hypothetical protein [Streptomyces ipomoeae]MDX2838021.1 hypothetical protein [Streptomyces ipomoeae]
MTTTWPFGTDAIQDDPLTALRIAVVRSSHPMWCYLVAFLDVNEEPYGWHSKERPTVAEALQLASYLDQYKNYWYNASYIGRMAERPLDVDGGANGVTFIKYGPDDWGYRRRTWTMGPTFVPGSPVYREHYPNENHIGPLSLPRLMDHIHSLSGEASERWTEWKADHPDVFPT